MRRTVVIAVSVAMFAGASACATEKKSSSSAAAPTKVEGSVTIACGVQEDLCQAWAKAFQADTGIKADFVRLSSGEAVARMTAGKASPEFDVWHGGPSDGYEAAREAGLLEPYKSPNATVIPVPYKDAESYWTGVYVGVLGFCSNKRVLSGLGVEVPKSWADLTNPKLRKQIAMAHPSTSGTAFTAVWTQVTLNGGNVDAAFGYLDQLHRNILQYSKSGSAPGQMAGRGEVGAGIVFSHDCIKYQKEGMKDLEVSFPSEGAGYEVGGVAVLKGAKHPNAAQKYVDWALTTRAQEIGATVNNFQVPTHPTAKVDANAVTLSSIKLVDYDAVTAAKRKKELTKRFDEKVAAQPRD